MSNHKAPKKNKTAKPPTIEYEGKIVDGNYWIKLGLSKAELRALKHVAQCFEHKQHRTTGKALMLVVTTALMHWEKIEPFVFSDEAYRKAEGFCHREIFQRDFLHRKFTA